MAQQFVERLEETAKDVAHRVDKVIDIDLSAATDAELENAVIAARNA